MVTNTTTTNTGTANHNIRTGLVLTARLPLGSANGRRSQHPEPVVRLWNRRRAFVAFVKEPHPRDKRSQAADYRTTKLQLRARMETRWILILMALLGEPFWEPTRHDTNGKTTHHFASMGPR